MAIKARDKLAKKRSRKGYATEAKSNEWIEREVFVYQPTTFYHDGITHVRSIIKTIKKVESINHQTSEVTNSTRIQFCIANFRESAEFFHDRILHHWKVETMHQYKDNALREDYHNCHLNPFLMTILRSIVLNILHLNGAKSIQEQLINNRWDLNDSITQLLNVSF